MKERPILFSGPMVRALLDGRKTQTRRIVKVPKHTHLEPLAPSSWDEQAKQLRERGADAVAVWMLLGPRVEGPYLARRTLAFAQNPCRCLANFEAWLKDNPQEARRATA